MFLIAWLGFGPPRSAGDKNQKRRKHHGRFKKEYIHYTKRRAHAPLLSSPTIRETYGQNRITTRNTKAFAASNHPLHTYNSIRAYCTVFFFYPYNKVHAHF